MELFRFFVVFAFVFGNSVKASEECYEDEEGCKRVIRKRRAAVEGSSCITGARSPQQASDELKGYEGQFAVNSYNDTTMTKKRQFLTTAKNLIPAVCKNLTVGSAPAQAISSLAGLHVQRRACNETNNRPRNVSCEGCSQIAKYRITENLLENNGRWNCSQDNDTCDGVCIGSLRMPKDLISNYSSGCRSHVVYVQMYNPKTAQPVTMNSSGEDMSVEIEFNGDSSKNDESDYKCYMWQHDAGLWDGSFCNLTILPRRSNQPLVAQCNCTRLGSVCVAFATTDMNSAAASSGGSSAGGESTTASSGGSSGGDGSTTASSGGSSGGDGSTTASSGGSSGGDGSTTASSGGSSGGDGSTTASSGGSSGGDGSTTASSGGSSGGDGSTTASSGGSSGGDGSTSASSGGSSGGDGSTSASSGGSSGGDGSTSTSSGGSSGSDGSTTTNSVYHTGTLYNSWEFKGECSTVKGTKQEQPFRTAMTARIQEALHVRHDQIFNLKITCGSIIVSFSLNQLDSSFLQHNITNIGNIVTSNFTVTLPDGTTFMAVQAGVGYSSSNFTIFTIPTPTIPPTTGKRYELVFDYTPIMAAVALGIASILLCVCCTCIIHSWYLRKNKFTEYNSMTIEEYEKKMKRKEPYGMEDNDIPMTNMAASTTAPTRTTNFDMTNEQMPAINERNLIKHDWARTSYLPGMLASVADTGMENAPRLILDEDSDSDSEEGQDNKGFEKSTLNIRKATSHLTLNEEDPDAESNDSLSQKNFEAPPVYDNITEDIPACNRDLEQQNIYDNINCRNADDDHDESPSSPPQYSEPEYSTIE